ncbi:hypothetical protein OHB25_10090 [Streptomyces mirabilis]|jgi:hypothetical protein|nr:hypothetical protein [Streptomyces mirabilis]MCX4614636.1 hypothetical protein [Streptomyces mirabilis]MCX5346692.1 hypothetical protein [Streptomyces mirabilis]
MKDFQDPADPRTNEATLRASPGLDLKSHHQWMTAFRHAGRAA